MGIASHIIRLIDWGYLPLFEGRIPRQTYRYAVCGGLNMALDALWYFVIYNFIVAHRYLDVGFVVISPHIASLMVVFPITFFNGFWLNRHVAFRASPLRGRTQLFRYTLSIAGSILLTYAGMKCFVEVCGIWPTPSKLLTTMITVVYSFLAAKYFTFRGCQAE